MWKKKRVLGRVYPFGADKTWPAPYVFVISIRSHRRMLFRHRMSTMVPMVRSWAGVNGETLSHIAGHPLKRGQLACFQSHYRIWKVIDNQKLAHGLIFEDDCMWNSDVNPGGRISDALAHLKGNWDVLLLGRNPRLREDRKTVGPGIVRTGKFWGCFGYLVSRRGARKLVRNPQIMAMKLPLDNLMSRLGMDGTLDIFVLNPEICTFVRSFKSDTFGIA
jgi:GR25 family glycosyltransferase involved in LPS biosynthesis